MTLFTSCSKTRDLQVFIKNKSDECIISISNESFSHSYYLESKEVFFKILKMKKPKIKATKNHFTNLKVYSVKEKRVVLDRYVWFPGGGIMSVNDDKNSLLLELEIEEDENKNRQLFFPFD